MRNTKQSGVVFIDKPGSPDVLTYQQTALPQPGPQQVLLAQKAIGVNFLDIFFRNGTFPSDHYPALIGLEASGLVEEVGSEVIDFVIGDRVAYYAANGAYAEKRVISANELVRLPDHISFEQAAAVMIKGLTAHMLLKQTHQLKAGEVVLIHAMTGGVGLLLSQWARALGATVLGTVGSAAKKQVALQHGFTDVIDLGSQDLAHEVNLITQGVGVDVVYDGIGRTTFHKSLTVLKEGGSAVLYGWSSGMPDISDALIARKKLTFSQGILNNYPLYQDKTGKGLADVFELISTGVYVDQPSLYPLSQAARAHGDIESRRTTGSIILVP